MASVTWDPGINSSNPTITMTVTQTSQSIPNNTSTVSWSLVLKRPSSVSSSVNKPYSVVIDGVTVASGSTSIAGSGDKTIASGTRTIQHGSDGKKTLSFSFTVEVMPLYWSGKPTGNASGSGLMTLTTIPRYAKITSFSLGSATRNSFRVNWATDKNVNRVEYKIGSGSWVAGSTSTAKSGNFTVSGRSAGTSYSVTIRVRAADSNLWTESSAKSISTVAAAKGNTPTLSSRTCTQAVMNWTSTQTCINVQYRIGSGSWQSTGSNFSARSSGSFTITGLSPNTSYSISIRVLDAVHSSWSGASGGISIKTYRLTTAGAPTFNTGSSFTVSLNRETSNLYHDVTLQFWHENQSWADVATLTNQTSSVTFNLTSAQLNQIYNGRTTSKTSTTRLKIVNRWGSGGAVQGTSYSSHGTLTIVNADPSIASVTYKDINSTIQAILGDDQKILRNKSDLRVISGQATSQKGATLKHLTVSIGGKDTRVSISGTSVNNVNIDVGKVDQSANQTAVLTVTDSRGYTASKSFTVQMLNYVEPQFLQASANRLNNYEEPSYINIEARRTIVKPADVDVNETYLRYRIKQNPSGEYGNYIDLITEDSYTSGIYQNFNVNQYMNDYPNNQSYTIELGIKDKFTDWNTILITLTEGIALLRFLQDRIEAGVPIIDSGTKHPYAISGGGEWVPRFGGSEIDGNHSYHTVTKGAYIRTGDVVIAWFNAFALRVDPIASGDIQITDLPVPVKKGSSGIGAIGHIQGVTLPPERQFGLTLSTQSDVAHIKITGGMTNVSVKYSDLASNSLQVVGVLIYECETERDY